MFQVQKNLDILQCMWNNTLWTDETKLTFSNNFISKEHCTPKSTVTHCYSQFAEPFLTPVLAQNPDTAALLIIHTWQTLAARARIAVS